VGRLILQTTMTVDALITVSDWFISEGGHDAASRDLIAGSDGMVLGRKTYDGLAGYWTEQEGPWADLINPMPKAVASRTLDGPLEWKATLVEGDAVAGVRRLKDESNAYWVLIGCGERGLVQAEVVDEAWFWIHPVLWGGGERPLGDEIKLRPALLDAQSFDSGVTLLRYAL